MAWLAGWAKRVKLTIDHDDIDAALSNFPILVYLSTSSGINAEDISFIFDELGANSLKIAVTKDDKITECYCEVEQWDSVTEKAWLWVKVPSIAADVNTDLYLYYDNTHADNTNYVGDDPNDAASQAVWDANSLLVYHMVGAAETDIDDSTSNNNDVTAKNGSPAFNQTGKIAKAVDFEVSTFDWLNVGDRASLDGFSDATWEVWINNEAIPDVPWNRGIISKYLTTGNKRQWLVDFVRPGTGVTPFIRIALSSDGATAKSSSFNWTPTAGVWYHVVWTWVGGAVPKLYINGVLQTLTVSIACAAPLFANDVDFHVADGHVTSGPFDGLIDEVRISNTARSAAWVKAAYQTEIDHLLDWGSEEIKKSASGSIVPLMKAIE